MSITIYTYSDPYRISNEPYWDEIKTCPYFCASQTLVNGLKELYYPFFTQGRVTTIRNLVEALYPEWESSSSMVRQHAALDQIITQGVDQTLVPKIQQNLLTSFVFNREEVFNSIRILFELNVNPADVLIEKLSPEQQFIMKVYQTILHSQALCNFIIANDLTEDYINTALIAVMTKAQKDCNVDAIQKDRVVIHGIHQFTPIILRTIEQLSKYKKVILLFNYQAQYAALYQTWIDIYAAFDTTIHSFNTPEFTPSLDYKEGYQSNVLGDSLGRMLNGQLQGIQRQDHGEIIEFDNVNEFASYVAGLYSEAVMTDTQNPLHAMREQIYAADSSVNDILRMYFPAQFGERQFLNYPIGHFFIAITNMWDSQLNEVYIRDPNDIRECLCAGILHEETLGELSSIYGKVSALFDGCTNINAMISRLKKVQRNKKRLTEPEEIEQANRISYYNVSNNDMNKLLHALTELDELANYFYEDFEDTSHNFREFYKKLQAYIHDQTMEADQLGEEYADILHRVLARLDEVKSIDASASFECLKATMNIYLVQETKPGRDANWIVRNFEQIDGDILRSASHPEAAIYHFACLSDEDINASKSSEFPWPLDASFFEVAQEPVDWKHQVYVKSRKEYKNFKRYALLYGLEFNRSKYRLSYVKRDGEKDQTLYSLLKILGFKVIPYKIICNHDALKDCSYISINGKATGTFSEFDYYRYQLCKYRFLNESLLEGDTIYKDAFLLEKYLGALLENKVAAELEGTTISEVVLTNKLTDAFEEIKRHFPFVKDINRIDLINTARNHLTNGNDKVFPKLTASQRRYMKIKEQFIYQSLSDPRTNRKNILAGKFTPVSAETISNKLADATLAGKEYLKEPDLWCKYCANRETCAICYSAGNIEEVQQ